MTNLINLFILPAFPWHFEEENLQYEDFLLKSRGSLFSPSAKLSKWLKMTKTSLPDLMSKINYLFWLKSSCSHFLVIILDFFSPNSRLHARFWYFFSTELNRKYFYFKIKIPDLLGPKNFHFAALFKHYVLKSQIWSFRFSKWLKKTKFWSILEWPEVFDQI